MDKAKAKYDAKQARRKQNRALRKQGLEVLMGTAAQMIKCTTTKGPQIGKLKKQAEADMRLRCNLNTEIDAGGQGAAAARKAKRKLNDVWTNRRTNSLGEFWNPNASKNFAK